ncbi:MAG: PhnD/SsuA/transferrin family substrate-binding protein [Candidatus Binatota bacterium]|nr:PhnD/SsuA/transferrin family substrate-binding protein [Candidatus Binatota bacterium]
MKTLKLASCMAENTEDFCRAIAGYLQWKLNVPTEYVTGMPWQEREALFDRGEIQVLWLCGLPYVHKADLAESSMELLAAPIPAEERYGSRPVYFSDVVVRRDNACRSFRDLRGATWAYNEPRSHSGFNVVRAHLFDLGENDNFFAAAVEAGAHSKSLQMILSGTVDGAAIDSTVLEWLISERGDLAGELRVNDTIGPSPIPPWVISKELPDSFRSQIRQTLLDLHLSAPGRAVLERAQVAQFVCADDRDYDPIRRMARNAAAVLLA